MDIPIKELIFALETALDDVISWSTDNNDRLDEELFIIQKALTIIKNKGDI